jgi:hypothetical protein
MNEKQKQMIREAKRRLIEKRTPIKEKEKPEKK